MSHRSMIVKDGRSRSAGGPQSTTSTTMLSDNHTVRDSEKKSVNVGSTSSDTVDATHARRLVACMVGQGLFTFSKAFSRDPGRPLPLSPWPGEMEKT